MSFKNFTALFFCLCLCSLSFKPFAKVPELPELTTDNFNDEYNRVIKTYDHIIKTTSKRLLRKFKYAKGNHHYHFTAKQTQLKNDYKQIQKQKYDIEPIHELKTDLVNLYLAQNTVSDEEKQQLDKEATLLAIGLFNEINRLEDKYKTFFLPVIHNMLIDIRLKKRGACKHWAEDLLNYLKPIPRRFFNVTWGEAYPGQILEHNVAVLIPKGSPFETGLFIDPWRTSGRPYWLKVTEDKHYPWKKWDRYDVY